MQIIDVIIVECVPSQGVDMEEERIDLLAQVAIWYYEEGLNQAAIAKRINGAHLVGPEVTELLPELALARAWELTPDEVARSVHAHPTLSEALMEAAPGVFGQVIHA